MICNKCGHHSEGEYGVCPFCGQPVVKKGDNNNTKLIVLLISLCGVLFVSLVIFGVILATSGSNSLAPDNHQTYTQAYVAPELSAEPLPDGSVSYKAEPTPQSDANYKKEPVSQAEKSLKKEPVKQEATTSARSVTADKKSSRIVSSAEIGEVNGKIYAVKNIGSAKDERGQYTKESASPVIPRLPINTDKFIRNFAVYDGYVYYTTTTDYDGIEGFKLYRCKTDFTSHELIMERDGSSGSEYNLVRTHFVIEDGVLFSSVYNSSDFNKQYECIDLKTKKIFYQNKISYKDTYKVTDGSVNIYDDVVFCSYNGTPEFEDVCMYMIKDGQKKMLIEEKDLGDVYLTGPYGYVDGYIYYAEDIMGKSVKAEVNTRLKRINVSTGEVQIVDEAFAGGGSDYFYR